MTMRKQGNGSDIWQASIDSETDPAYRWLKQQRAGVLRNKARRAERALAWKVAHPRKVLAYAKKYYSHHAEAVKLDQSNRRAGMRLLGKDAGRIIAAAGGRCTYCGCESTLGLDHVIPLARGGSHEPGNLVAACKTCNGSKSARELAEWSHQRLLQVLKNT